MIKQTGIAAAVVLAATTLAQSAPAPSGTAIDIPNSEIMRIARNNADAQALLDKYGGGPVGVGTLAAALSEEEDAIEEMYEPYLMQIGMIDRTPRGRVATPLAYEYFNREQPRRQPRLF